MVNRIRPVMVVIIAWLALLPAGWATALPTDVPMVLWVWNGSKMF